MKGNLSPTGKEALQQWVNASERHKALYQLFCDKANLQKSVRKMKGLQEVKDKAELI